MGMPLALNVPSCALVARTRARCFLRFPRVARIHASIHASPSQLYLTFLDILKMRRQRNLFKGAFVAAVVLLSLCTLGTSTAEAIITNETYSNGNMLTTAKGEVIRTAPASYALELIAAPVMPVHVHVCMFSLTRVPGHVSSRGGGLP